MLKPHGSPYSPTLPFAHASSGKIVDILPEVRDPKNTNKLVWSKCTLDMEAANMVAGARSFGRFKQASELQLLRP